MITPYKHISFDLDGTLVHTTESYLTTLVPKVVESLGGTWKDATIKKFWFETNRSQTIKDCFGVDPETFWKIFNEEDVPESRKNNTRVYPECVSVLKRIKALGKTISILTGSPRGLAEMEIALLQDVSLDHVCPITDSGFESKPDPGSMHHALRTLGHAPEDTLYIGNGAEDALFAEAAGCDFVLVDRGEHEVTLASGHQRIHSLEELFA
jgi:phosphoglycolate phosphatase-like HAD superfamily hydrolase